MNYDQLLEDAIHTWAPEPRTRTARNTNLLETAEIVQSRASHFVFKPHGDIDDLDSIILTREQYRKLLPNGKFHIAMETLRTLLLTRKVVYVGFGFCTDPDFLYTQVTFWQTSSTRHRHLHYAVMSDIIGRQTKESIGEKSTTESIWSRT